MFRAFTMNEDTQWWMRAYYKDDRMYRIVGPDIEQNCAPAKGPPVVMRPPLKVEPEHTPRPKEDKPDQSEVKRLRALLLAHGIDPNPQAPPPPQEAPVW